MNPLLLEAQSILANLQHHLARATTCEEVEAIRIATIGRKGRFTAIMRTIASLTPDEKRTVAPPLQELQRTIESAVRERLETLQSTSLKSSTSLDSTAFIRTTPYGGLHPYTLIIEHITTIFSSLGWSIVEGPEVEDEFHNFEALNIPQHHPARDDHDTLWLATPHRLLRTHTSSVQIRALRTQRPPLAICAPGRVFRHEATDATHDAVFMQCEGLFIESTISLTHLVGTLKLFMQQLFDAQQLAIRLRPSYFPFVRPGLEVDISCIFCTKGCTLCKQSRWIELGGAGLVHPEVLRAASLDPARWRGFAFGFGIERLAMLIYRIPDIRLFKTTKLSILEQFSQPRGNY